MSEWAKLFKKWLKRGDFVEVHPSVLQNALNLHIELLKDRAALVRWINEELKWQIDGQTGFNDAYCTNTKEREEAYQALSQELKDAISKGVAEAQVVALEAGDQRDCDNCSTTGLLCPIRNQDPPFSFPCPHWKPLNA